MKIKPMLCVEEKREWLVLPGIVFARGSLDDREGAVLLVGWLRVGVGVVVTWKRKEATSGTKAEA